MSESSFVITAALTVFFVGLFSWFLIIYFNYRISKQISALVKGQKSLVFLFTGFGLGYAAGFGAGACAFGAVGSAFISMYLFKSVHRSKVALHGQGLSS